MQFPTPEVQEGCGGTRESPVEGYQDGSMRPTKRLIELGLFAWQRGVSEAIYYQPRAT